jgi:hypothetical protein
MCVRARGCLLYVPDPRDCAGIKCVVEVLDVETMSARLAPGLLAWLVLLTLAAWQHCA